MPLLNGGGVIVGGVLREISIFRTHAGKFSEWHTHTRGHRGNERVRLRVADEASRFSAEIRLNGEAAELFVAIKCVHAHTRARVHTDTADDTHTHTQTLLDVLVQSRECVRMCVRAYISNRTKKGPNVSRCSH